MEKGSMSETNSMSDQKVQTQNDIENLSLGSCYMKVVSFNSHKEAWTHSDKNKQELE